MLPSNIIWLFQSLDFGIESRKNFHLGHEMGIRSVFIS